MGSSGCGRCCLFIISAFLIRLSKNHSTVLKPAPMTIKLVPPPTNNDLLDSLLSLSLFLCGEPHALFRMLGVWHIIDQIIILILDLFFAKSGIFSKFFTHLKMLNRASAAHQTKVVKKGAGVRVTPRSQTTRVTGTRTTASWRRRRLCCLLRYSTRLQLGYWEMEGRPVKHNKLVLKVEEISRYRFVL